MPLEPASGEGRDIPIPQTLGKYVPIARLGSGGMAEVFLAVARGPVRFNKLAVVKRLRNSDDPVQVEMFLDEARLTARLNHANIVHTYEVGESHGKYFIAMEYLEGQSLHALVARLKVHSTGLSDALVAYVAAQALKGLHFAHELRDFDGTPLGVVHRDVSPHNLYLTYDGEVKVLDFGVAKTNMNAGHTEIGMVKGKIRYMAPEQLGDGDVDQRADVFAFGVVLWELLARRPLFQGDAPSVMARVVGEDVAPVRTHRPEASPELEAIAVKALKRNPDERYANADAMRDALESFLRGKNEPFDRDLSRLMNETFAQTRDEVRDRIRVFLDEVPPDESGDNVVASAVAFGRTSDLPTLPKGTDSGSPQAPPVTTGATAPQPRGPRWSWLLLVVGVSVSGVIALGRLGRQIQEPATAVGASGPPGAIPTAAPRDLGGRRPPTAAPEPANASALAPAAAPEPAAASALAPTVAPEPATASALAPASASALPPPPAPSLAHPKPAVSEGDHRPPLAPASARPRVNIRVLDDSDSP
jgi:serine/threonine protein kinase